MEYFTQQQAARFLNWAVTDIKKAITSGVHLPQSGALIMLKAEVRSDQKTVIAEHELEDFIASFESEEPGRHPPASVRRTLLVEANH